MYVYKKKCDEEYYLNIIRSTQQEAMFYNQPNHNFYRYQKPNQFYNYSYSGPMSYNNLYNNNYNYNNIYRTPENRNHSRRFNEYYNNNSYNGNPMSPSPLLSKKENQYGYHDNGNRKHIMEDQILSNKVNSINNINNTQNDSSFQKINNDNEYEPNKRFNLNNYQDLNNNNFNYNIKKKVYKLEDFLSGSKRNKANDQFNTIIDDIMN